MSECEVGRVRKMSGVGKEGCVVNSLAMVDGTFH